MQHFNKFYNDINTVDYLLLCGNLWYLEDVPLTLEPLDVPKSKEEIKQELKAIYGELATSFLSFIDRDPEPIFNQDDSKAIRIVKSIDMDMATWGRYFRTEQSSIAQLEYNVV